MGSKKDIRISFLYCIILFLMAIFILSTCTRLIFGIIRSFIYLSGQITILIFFLLILGGIALLVKYILKSLSNYKRSPLSTQDTINLIISVEVASIKFLFIIMIISFITLLLIK